MQPEDNNIAPNGTHGSGEISGGEGFVEPNHVVSNVSGSVGNSEVFASGQNGAYGSLFTDSSAFIPAVTSDNGPGYGLPGTGLQHDPVAEGAEVARTEDSGDMHRPLALSGVRRRTVSSPVDMEMTSLVYGGKPGAFSGWRGDHHDTSMDEWGQDDSLLGEAVTFDMLYPDLNGMSDLSLNSTAKTQRAQFYLCC